MQLKNKVAIVTGASAGIGRATALRFAEAGAHVIAVARRQNYLEELVEESKPYKGEIIPFVGDISLRATNESMIDFAIGKFEHLDILVNNAGTMDDFVPIGELMDEEWQRVMDVNLYGPMTAMRRAVQVMQRQADGGTIVNVASVAGYHGGRSGAAYVTSKAGLINLSMHTAFLYSDQKIRCNCINPGGVSTEITIKTPNKLGITKAELGHPLMNRLGTSEEVAAAILFLASCEASFVNGAVLTIDGGWTAY